MKKPLPLLILPLALAGCAKTGVTSDVATATPGIVLRLPAGLRNDAYDYYGLANDKPQRLEFTSGEGGEPAYGTRTITLKGIKDGKATYFQHHTGALSREGDVTLSLDGTGLYVVASTQGKLTPSMEIPAKMDVGGHWTDHTSMTQEGQDIDLVNELQIERKERVATPGGTFDDALYVTSTGKGTLGGKPVSLVTKHWYVKGLGPVKEIIEVHPDKGPANTITIQLAPPPKPGEPMDTPTPGLGSLDASPMGAPSDLPSTPPAGGTK